MFDIRFLLMMILFFGFLFHPVSALSEEDNERADLPARIQEAREKLRRAEHQAEKYEAYIEKQAAVNAELRRRKAESEKMEMALAPFLDDLLDRLKAFVEKDLPFLPDERRKRLESLARTLNDFHAPLSEKSRRILEALRIEMEYGSSVETGSAEIDFPEGPVRVDLFRLGRTALYYRTPDRGRCGRFNREKGEWEALPERYAPEIAKALAIADKERTPELLTLPVGKAAAR